MSTKDVITRYYQLANAGEWDAWSDLFTIDMVMDEQLAGHIEGRETLRDMMKGFPGMYKRFTNNPKHILGDGGEGAAVSHISAETASGGLIEAEVMNYFRVTDEGLISYMANFHDTVVFKTALGQ